MRQQKEALNEIRKMSVMAAEDVSVSLLGVSALCKFSVRMPSQALNSEIPMRQWARIFNTLSLSKMKSFPLPKCTYSSSQIFLWQIFPFRIYHLSKVGRGKKKAKRKSRRHFRGETGQLAVDL